MAAADRIRTKRTSIRQLWRTTTVRLTALFILIFVLFSILLLGYMAYQSSIAIQRQQTRDIAREIAQLQRVDEARGIRELAFSVQRLANRPGPGIYYLGTDVGQMVAGNVGSFPAGVLAEEGTYTFTYDREDAFDAQPGPATQLEQGGYALVRSVVLDSGFRLVVGRDIVERRGFTAIIFGGLAVGVVGIVILSALAGGLTAMRVIRRIDGITATSRKIMSGNLSERVPVTRRSDEFDELAQSLNRMLDRIQGLMQGMKEVTDNVAHDLKTPLTRMRNRAEAALREENDPEKTREALETTIAESEQLIRTFNALLMIARAEAGTPTGAFADTDVSRIVADMADLYEPVAEELGSVLATDIDDGLRARANKELLGQAVVNLIENALKYAAPGDRGREIPGSETGDGTDSVTGRIGVSAKREDDRIVIEVADKGPGIPEAERERVLERFVRLEESRTETGSGLGLALVSAVAQLHGGEFRIEDNEPGVRAVLALPAD